GEDFGWNKRASDLGIGLVYGEDVVVKHPARRDLKELVSKKRRVVGGKNFHVTSIKDAYQLAKYLPGMFLFNLVPGVYSVLRSRKGFSLLDKLKIVYVCIYLYCVTIHEYVRLLFGKQSAR